MAFENEAQAAEALAAAVNAPEGEPPAQVGLTMESVQTQQQPNQFEAPQPETRVETGDQGEQAQQESFTPSKDIDLSGLNDDQIAYLQAREREMQAHFTQRTQELAAERQQATEAIQFINELNTNPYFASQVVQELSGQLQAAGYSPAQANQIAEGQVAAQQAQQQPQGVDDMGFSDYDSQDDPYLAEINDLRAKQAEVDNYLNQMREQQRIATLEAQLNNQAAYVQSQNPNFTDADMARVVNMSYAFGGDLVRASEEYKAIQQGAVQGWIDQKGTVNTPAPVSGGTTAQSAPEPFKGLDDPRLEAAAQARLAAVLGNG